ncbi:MAG: hypothetical protein EA402_00455 [Planctomycetota bacterium]|nr:MAG: hypothetical protein EA402_00455 [Planctomycetota bacterium]
MAGVLPLIFALLIAHAALVGGWMVALDVRAWWVLPLSLIAWAMLTLGLSRVCACTARPLCWLRRWDHVGLAVLLGLHAWWCFALGWAQVSGISLLILLPVLLGLLLHWLALAQAAQPRHAEVSVWASLGLRFRFVVLPVLIIIGAIDLLHLISLIPGLDLWLQSGLGLALLMIAGVLLPIMVLIGMPPLLVRLWGARPMAPSPAYAQMQDLARQSRVRVGGILLWPSRGVPFYNAAVLGLVPRWRYILISEDLLRDCPPEQVQAVLGHELGHARHGHLWWYLLFLLTSGLWAQVLSDALTPMFALAFGWPVALVQAVLWVLVMVVLLRLGFGVLSRACERQADLFGARISGDPQYMAAALNNVAYLSGSDPAEPNWRHHSIAERVAYLERLRQSSRIESLHHRYLMNLRALILILLAIGLVLTFMAPPRHADLAQLREQDTVLNQALILAADEANDRPLARWLLRQEPRRRQALAAALLQRLGDEQILADDRLLYAHRHWLLPFTEVSTGDDRLDLYLDNALAYAIAAGTRSHNEDELALLRQLLEPLQAGAERLESAAIWDTVGSMHMVLDERSEAISAFQRAQQLLAERDDQPALALRRILAARIRAAMVEGQPLPVVWGLDGDLTIEGLPVVPAEDGPEVDTSAGDRPHNDAAHGDDASPATQPEFEDLER